MGHGHDGDALAGRVGQPQVQRDADDLAGLVQREQQRRVQPALRGAGARQRGLALREVHKTAEQRLNDHALSAGRHQVQGPAREAANRAASNGRAAGPATMAATDGTATQVRDLAMVMRILSGRRPSRVASANTERSTDDAAGWWARAEPPMASPERLAQSQMSRTVRPDRAAACSSADSASAALSCQKVMSPVPPTRGPISASARVNASAGSWHPATTSQPKVDGTRPIPNGLNTWTTPRRHRAPAVLVNRSARVDVAMTAPGQSSIQSASAPDLPLRGGASSVVRLHRAQHPLTPLGPAQPDGVVPGPGQQTLPVGQAGPGPAAPLGGGQPARPW